MSVGMSVRKSIGVSVGRGGWDVGLLHSIHCRQLSSYFNMATSLTCISCHR